MKQYSIIIVFTSLMVTLLSGCSHALPPDPNWNFESGDFTGWTKTGNAFQVSDSTTFSWMRYYQQVGLYHVLGSVEEMGTLTSQPISLTHSGYISFLIGGSMSEKTYVEVVLNGTDQVIERVGNDFYEAPDYTDSYLRVNLDLSDYLGETVVIHVVDGSPIDYLNVDDFVVDYDISLRTQYLVDTNIRLGLERDDNMVKAANDYIQMNAWKIQPQDRFSYHVTGQIGWVNDPNGFSYYDGKIHLFYQHNPYQTQWGPMHWGHVTSPDFVKWDYQEVALAPDQPYDVIGVFSGSAIQYKGTYYLVYTGVSEGKQQQAIATSSDGVHFTKFEGNPVISEKDLPANASIGDFRDPKVWEKDGVVYMIVSNRNLTNQYSKLLLYKTTDMIHWTYGGKIFSNNSNWGEKLGIMFECPDFFEMGDSSVILVSPQTATGHPNADSNVYIVGNLNYETGALENWNYDEITQIDDGFDFYAPQTMLMPDGRRIMVAWMASWNRKPIYFGTGIAGAMTFPRELWLEGKKLFQWPVHEIENYYTETIEKEYSVYSLQTHSELAGWKQDITLSFTPSEGKTGISVFADETGKGMKIFYENGRVYIDRSVVTEGYYANNEINNLRSVEAPLVEGQVHLRLLIDRYSVEVFVSDGYKAMTATGYPQLGQSHVALFSDEPTSIEVIRHLINL